MNEHKRQAKIKAYINPQMVNSNFLNAAWKNHMLQPNSSKILINPNFKRSDTALVHNNRTRQPINNVHINPNFINQQKLGGSEVVLKNTAKKSKVLMDPSKVTPKPVSYSINLYNNKTKINFNNKVIKENDVRNSESSSKILSESIKNSLYYWHNTNNHKTCLRTPEKKELNKVTLNQNRPVKSPSPSQFKFVKGKKSNQTPIKASPFSKKMNPVYASRTKIINRRSTSSALVLNKNKFNYLDKKKILLKKRLQLLHLKISNTSKMSPTVKVAASVKSKYKYTSKTLVNKNRINLKHINIKCLKYNIDRRKILPKRSIYKNKYKIEKLFPNNTYRISPWWPRTWSNASLHSWKRKGSNTISCKNIKHYPNRTVVKIGGILYKSSQSKLTRTKGKKKSVSPTKQEPKIHKNKSRSIGVRNHIVYVRGEKFILDKSGKSLKRLPQQGKISNNKKINIKRIDIGGVTYMSKSNNVLIRTNTHHARYVVNHAKQKSIALLSNLRKRNYMPCMIYSRLGKCARHEKGLCAYTHDKKNIALCKKFLKGECISENCLLSHDLVQEKMATCHFFISGCCINESCPYLHVKVNSKAPICKDFIQGFCSLGKDCMKRHENLCPEFDEKGKCSKGDKCLYPHKSKSKRETKENKTWNKLKTSTIVKKEKADQKVRKTKRLLIQNEKDLPMEKKTKRSAVEVTDKQEVIPKRVKLDILPCFIPLDSSTKSS